MWIMLIIVLQKFSLHERNSVIPTSIRIISFDLMLLEGLICRGCYCGLFYVLSFLYNKMTKYIMEQIQIEIGQMLETFGRGNSSS